MQKNYPRVVAVIPARNESKFLGSTLEALNKQILKPNKVIVVNDGSKDDTHDIAVKHKASVIDIQDRGFRATGLPVLAEVINKGLGDIQENECEYILILGADHILTPEYIDTIVEIMEKNKRIAIASGVIKGESQREKAPRGSGRIVRYDFWKKIGLRYPTWFGFESYIVFKALADSYEVCVVRDLVSMSQRPTGKDTDYKSYGKAMRALGYHPLYALGRSALAFTKTPKGALWMFLGYCNSGIKKYDVAQFVCKYQTIEIRKKIGVLINRLVKKN